MQRNCIREEGGTRCSELQNGLPIHLPFTCIYLSSVCVCTQCHGTCEGLDSLLQPHGLFQDPTGDHQGGGLHFSALSYHVDLTLMAYRGAIHDLLRVAISHIKILFIITFILVASRSRSFSLYPSTLISLPFLSFNHYYTDDFS